MLGTNEMFTTLPGGAAALLFYVCFCFCWERDLSNRDLSPLLFISITTITITLHMERKEGRQKDIKKASKKATKEGRKE